MVRTLAVGFACLLISSLASAQGTKDDYERWEKLPTVRANTLRQDVQDLRWAKDSQSLTYRTTTKSGKRVWFEVDPSTGKQKEISEPKAPAEPTTPSRPRRGPGGPEKGPQRGSEVKRPAYRVEIVNHNVVLKALDGDQSFTLTTDGTAADPYTNRIWWSPNADRFVVQRRSVGAERRVTLVESTPKDQLQPKTTSYFYLKPGDEVPKPRPYLFDANKKQLINVNQDLFLDPWDNSYERWSADGNYFYFLFNERGHQAMRLIRIDAETGEAKAIIAEEPETFFDYSQKTYLRYLNGATEALWMSERSGYNHLYRVDLRSGKVLNAVTAGNWLVRSVVSVDDEQKELLLRVMGYYPEQSPYHVHYAKVKFDGTGFTMLTTGDGTHTLSVSPDGAFGVATFSRVDLPPVSELINLKSGQRISTIATADESRVKATGRITPERFVAPGRDGKTPIHGVIFRPTTFDPAKKYRVIEYIYAGPHSHHVPIDYRPLHYQQERMAELGFIVVMIDGMGTNWRSKAFHDVCWKNLGDSGFPDRMLWIRAAAEKHPEMDLAGGVGIFGGSAGGQSSTRALLAFGEFYTVAVSDCGCHDNRMDKIWWNEAWMGKLDKHYEDQSNSVHASKLQGKLMLVVGELDRNVDPSSTYQLAAALIQANKDFDYLVMPGAGHGAAESPYGQRRRADFFVRHLAGVEPRR